MVERKAKGRGLQEALGRCRKWVFIAEERGKLRLKRRAPGRIEISGQFFRGTTAVARDASLAHSQLCQASQARNTRRNQEERKKKESRSRLNRFMPHETPDALNVLGKMPMVHHRNQFAVHRFSNDVPRMSVISIRSRWPLKICLLFLTFFFFLKAII